MLFFIILLILILSIFSLLYVEFGEYDQDSKGIKNFLWEHRYGCEAAFGVLTAVVSIAFGFSLIVLCYNYINAPAEQAMSKEIYNSLIYKSETEAIRDDFGIINKEYIDEVQVWNVNVVQKKVLTNNFWVGVYYPNWYNELETIDLDNIKMKE